MVSFVSTRTGEEATFARSVPQGSARDGGLLVPSEFPQLHWSAIRSLPDRTPSQIGKEILRGFVPAEEMDDFTLQRICEQALTFDLPLETLDDHTFILRLDQGPTASFKDIAARTLAGFLQYVCEKEGKSVNLIVATSGDTGVAIADAFSAASRVSVTVLYPDDGVSSVQEAQMVDVDARAANVRCFPVKGNFDVAQDYAKVLQAMRGITASPEALEAVQQQIRTKLREELDLEKVLDLSMRVDAVNLSSANSINIWRLLPQMVQYFEGYGSAVRSGKVQMGEEVVFGVPSGNGGHLMAGLYAKEMGLPVKGFVAGTNANNILAYVIGGGVLRHKGFKNTRSPSMDILDPSNLERLLHFAAWKTGETAVIDYEGMKGKIKDMQRVIETRGAKKLPEEWMLGIPLSSFGVTPKMFDYLKSVIWAEDIREDDDVIAKMLEVERKTGLVLEPHGTVGLMAVERARKQRGFAHSDASAIVLETAHPGKFPDSMRDARIDPKTAPKHPDLARLDLSAVKQKRREVITGIERVLEAIEGTARREA